jgi:LytS/YehU family sensor histidine kinase
MDSLTLDDFTFVPIAGFEEVQSMAYRQVFRFDDDHYFFIQDTIIYSVNYSTSRVEHQWRPGPIVALTKMKDGALLAFDLKEKQIRQIDLENLHSTYPFASLRDQYGQPVEATFRYAEWINESDIILTTEKSGIYIYSPAQNTIRNYRHHFADPSSLGASVTSTIQVHPTGWVFITCAPAGLSYFDTREVVHTQSVFTAPDGTGYDGYIAAISTRDNEHYYIGTAEGLFKWHRPTNHVQFLHYTTSDGLPLPSPQEIVNIVIDSLRQKWITTITQGIFVIDAQDRLRKHFYDPVLQRSFLKIERIYRLYLGPDQYIWACGRNGITRIHPGTLEEDPFENHPLSFFDTLSVAEITFDEAGHLWAAVGSGGGVVKCDLADGHITRYRTADGLIHAGIFDIGADAQNNLFVGTRGGLSIIHANGRIKSLTQKDGLIMDRAEGLLSDDEGNMWIGNDIGLVCYTSADSSLRTFDTRHGLSVYGFRVGSYFRMPNGEFMLGTPHGLQYFFPKDLLQKEVSFTTLVHKIETSDLVSTINSTATFQLASSDRQVTFHFSTIDFSPFVRTYYQYQLVGMDAHWQNIADQHAVRYNALPPGKYTFKVRVSHDNRHWQPAENEVHVQIATPYYRQTWFVIVSIVLLGLLTWMLLRNARKKQSEQREQLETEAVIHYFASQINRHKNTNELLWDVAKNCISKLDLEECVIYLLDPTRNVLVQTAAHGPKNPDSHTILQPIEIPMGQGITGTVALNGKAEIVNNTQKDHRYIVDDASRQSEIAVPILLNDAVIGVIDSENAQKNFFTPRHLSVLTAIAVLTATQLQRIQAEQDKQKAEIEGLKNKQKATESRLQSLRLQMNPHFLFNALNSIQQMILANEEMVATKYLSRFSKLLRSILIHSDKESISLREELDILRLYVELESVRFKEAFTYQILCDEDIDTDEVKIPTLLIQPFVENAIWHGLMHKEGMRELKISFTDKEDHVQCIIEDNGIGRQAAREMKITSGQDKKHTSKGIEVSLERLRAMNKNGSVAGSLEIIDLMDQHGKASGTRVEINLPIQN